MAAKKNSYSVESLFKRLKIFKVILSLGVLIIIFRLAFWQIWKHTELSAVAANQYESNQRLSPQRGNILDNQGRALVGNVEQYVLFAQPHIMTDDIKKIVDQLAPVLQENLIADASPIEATDEGWLKDTKQSIEDRLGQQLFDKSKKWVALATGLSRQQKQVIENFKIHGLGFDSMSVRAYPDASLSAHLLGFVGKTQTGDDQGYFGLEGFYDLELQGRGGLLRQQKTAIGLPLLLEAGQRVSQEQGATLKLTLNRQLQFVVEQKLKDALIHYGAKSGEVIIMDPQTGAILTMASFPNYDPSDFPSYPSEYYRNPTVSELYEPGSTMKIVTMAAGIESGAVNPETTCDRCSGPRVINNYQIRTWNEVYNPNINMWDALAKSDNTAMVFVQERIGRDRFLQILRDFGFAEPTNIDLQGEATYNFRANEQWRPIDTATASFGQGIATTSIQLLRAAAAIANGGRLIQPFVVLEVIQEDNISKTAPKIIRQVISPETAATVTEMMVYTAQHGDAQWALPEGVEVAGKTGTAQIAGEGGYLEDKTIASFIGFAPANDPKFVMLVKLNEPSSSPWGSETAAPLWFAILPEVLKWYN